MSSASGAQGPATLSGMEVMALSAAAAAASAFACFACSASRDASPATVPQGEGFEAIGEAQGDAVAYIDALADKCGEARSSKVVAEALDKLDRLACFRTRFHFPQREGGAEKGLGTRRCRYFVGNSLGLQPKGVRAEVEAHLLSWERRAVEGHFVGDRQWLPIEDSTRDLMAAVVGAQPDEVVCMNTLTVNLHLGMAAFYRPRGKRNKIVVERRCFPSDEYAVQSVVQQHGLDPEEAILYIDRRSGEEQWRTEDIVQVIEEHGETIALVMLSGVQYLNGQLFDIATITAAGHRVGANVGWDLAHAVGNIDLQLHDWGPDFACWCTYKYLNSGPGNIGGFFLHNRHKQKSQKELPRLAGWWGHQRSSRFQMDPKFIPIEGAYSFQLSNPPVLCMASLLVSLRLFDEAGGMSTLVAKSRALTGYLEMMLSETKLTPGRVTILTPADPRWRGCQLSLRFDCAVDAVERAMRNRGIMVDTRKPNVMRVAPIPLYNSFDDVHAFVVMLREALSEVAPGAGL